MAAGMGEIGLLYFGAVKFAGYSLAAWGLNRVYVEPKRNILIVGAVRTVIGIAAGIGSFAAMEVLGAKEHAPLLYAALFPIRMLEWLLLTGVFYQPPWKNWSRNLLFAALCSIWSYILDIPAIAAMFALPGGVWIC